MSKSISGAKIFGAGAWTGSAGKQTFTEADLDGIVQAFIEAGKAGRVPLKFGHAEDDENGQPSAQPFRAGMPALGWVSRIWREGKSLLADFTDIPSTVFESIRKGLYKFTSIELLKNVEYGGKRFPLLLDAVALLGADPPAVDDVSDLQKLALSRASFTFAEAVSFTAGHVPVIRFSKGDRTTMTEEEMRAAVAKAQQAEAEAKRQLAERDAEKIKLASEAETLKADNAKKDLAIAEQAKQVKADKVKLARDKAKSVLEAAVRTKKIAPAKRELFTKMLNIDNDDAVLALNLKDVEQMCDMSEAEAAKIMASGKSGFSRDPGEDQDDHGEEASTGEDHGLVTDLYTACVKRAKETGKNIFTVMADVVREDPKLGKRFLGYVFDNDQAA